MITFLRSGCWSDRRLLATLLLFRVFNAIILQTYYVADEYWQSLEVAHRMAFGYGHLTWEWHQGIRGYSYPLMFAVVYKTLENLHLDHRYLLVLCPKLIQACFSAVSDLFLYKLSLKLFGAGAGFWCLLCHVSSWFIFYTAPRTLTNSMEMIISVVGLYFYPWSLIRDDEWRYKRGKRQVTPLYRTYMVCVALSCTVRSTAAILWAPLCTLHLQRTDRRLDTVLRGFIPIGAVTLYVTMLIDKIFHGHWVNVHYNFLITNFMSDIGAFYGVNPWHWYLTQGLPVVLGPQLILCLLGIYHNKGHQLPAYLILWLVALYSYLSHKEFRFLLPVVPLAHMYAGVYLEALSRQEERRGAAEVEFREGSKGSARKKPTAKMVMIGIVLVNMLAVVYMSLVHQRGTLDVMRYLHGVSSTRHSQPAAPPLAVLFLMPCHSTPYYSHIHSNITLRFLTCEPNLSNLQGYVDEADLFYSNPTSFLRSNLNVSHYSHIVMFSSLRNSLKDLVKGEGFRRCESFFHAHITTDTRVGTHVLVYCKETRKT